VPTFNYVEVWPPTGWPDRPWCDDVEKEAFVKSARSIIELYTEVLVGLGVQGWRSMLRLVCCHVPSLEHVLVLVSTDRSGDFEGGSVHLPSGVAALPATARSLLVLDVVHAAVLRLADARGWEGSQFEGPRQHVLNSGLQYRWDGPWKSSPDRRHRARSRFRLMDDGYGRARIEVQRRDNAVTVAVSGEALAFSTSKGFERSARTLRWDGSSAVHMIPYSGLWPSALHGLVRLESTEDGWRSFTDGGIYQGRTLATLDTETAEPTDGSDSARPLVVVRGNGPNAPDSPPRIRVIGGGPMNHVPKGYITTLTALLNALAAPAGQDWWLAADVKELEVSYDFEAERPRIRTWRGRNQFKAVIERPTTTTTTAVHPEQLARDDVEALITAVRRRTGLGPHPELPG